MKTAKNLFWAFVFSFTLVGFALLFARVFAVTIYPVFWYFMGVWAK